MRSDNKVIPSFSLPVLATCWLPLALIILAVSYYFHFLSLYGLNIPLQDDVYDVLQFILNVTASDDFHSTVGRFLQQHNDHRTSSSRLMYYAAYLVEGEVNFQTLIFLSNLALPLILGILYFSVCKMRYGVLLLLPSALILFQLRSYGVTLWSMAAFAYFYVFLYGFGCIYCLHNVNWHKFSLALLLASLANFTLASGQLIWLFGLASLLHQSLLLKKIHRGYVLLWLAVAIPMLIVWNSGLETPLSPVHIFSNVVSAPLHHLHYFLALLGSAASETSVAFATVVGAVILISLTLLSARSYKDTDIRLALCCWYIVVSVLAIVSGRAYFTEVQYALTSRYSFPSVLMLSTLWLFVALKLKLRNPVVLALVALLATVYTISSYKIYSRLLQPHVEARVNWYNKGVYPAWGSPKGEAKGIVKEAISRGIYKPPPVPYPVPAIGCN